MSESIIARGKKRFFLFTKYFLIHKITVVQLKGRPYKEFCAGNWLQDTQHNRLVGDAQHKHKVSLSWVACFLIMLSAVSPRAPQLGNCYIDFLIFCLHFGIIRVKFLKFEKDQNATEKFWIYITEKQKTMKFDKSGWNYCFTWFTTLKFH